MTQSILFVCLGNICRSPAAEGVFNHQVKAKNLESHFNVDSAGTGAWHVGNKADLRMREAARRRGVSINSRARQILPQDLINFDFIFTMDDENFLSVNKLAAKVDACPKAIIQPILRYASNTKMLEVPDPYYGGESGFEYVLDLLEDACEGLLKELISRD